MEVYFLFSMDTQVVRRYILALSANDQSQHTYMTMICDRSYVDALHSVMSRLFTSSCYNYIDIHFSSFITQANYQLASTSLKKVELPLAVCLYICVCV